MLVRTMLSLAVSLAVAGSGYGSIITVTTLDDELNGDYDCSLREAVGSANADSAIDGCMSGSGYDIIQFADGLAGSIILSLGELEVTESVDFEVAPNPIRLVAGAGARIMRIAGSTAFVTVNGAVFEGGHPASFYGGAVRIDSGPNVTFTSCTFRSNGTSGTPAHGGAVYFAAATYADALNIFSCRFENNSSSTDGGALYTLGGTITVFSSVFEGNTASGNGGAIVAYSSNLTVRRSAIIDNSAATGGGVYAAAGSTVDVENATVAGNMGCGFYFVTAHSNLVHVTVYDNDHGPALPFAGGVNLLGFGSHTVRNSIIGGNRGAIFDDCEAWGNDSQGWSSGGYNVLEDAADCTAGVTSDFVGVTPVIDMVGDWGGDTVVAMPALAPPVIDAIPAADCTNLDGAALGQDQRGETRPINLTAGFPLPPARCDVGAVERQLFEYSPLILADGFETGDTSAWSDEVP